MGTRKGRLIKMFTPLLNNFINTKLIFIYFFLFFSFWCHFYELFLYEKLFYMFSLTWENLPYFLVFLPQYLIPVSFYFFYEVGSPVYIFFFFFHFEDIFHLCGWCFIEDTFYWILFLIVGWYITYHHAFEVPLKVWL